MIYVPRKKILLPRTAQAIPNVGREKLQGARPALSMKVIVAGLDDSIVLYQDKKLAASQRKSGKTKLQRSVTVAMVFPTPVYVSETKVTRPGSSVHVYEGNRLVTPIKSIITISHERSKGRQKILARYFLANEIPSIDMGNYLARFGRIVGVDTNTMKKGNGEMISATAMVDCFLEGGRTPSTLYRTTRMRARIERDVKGNPERFGWFVAVKTLLEEEADRDGKFLLVVDSDLDLLESIQERRTPLWEDYYLPTNIEIAFGTGDSGSEEFIPCFLVRQADAFAKNELAKY